MGSEPARHGREFQLCFPCRGATLVAARECEQRVFGRRYGNTPEQLRGEYGPFEGGCNFGAVLLPDGRAAGAVRLLRNGPWGLKTLLDAARPPWSLPAAASARKAGLDLTATWDVATFGVDAEHVGAGSQSVTMALFAVMFGAFRDNAVTSFVAVLDAGARRPIEALGVQMTDLPGASPAPYLGSPMSGPVYAHVRDLHAHHARNFGDIHRQVFHGGGIGGVDPDTVGPGRFALGRPGGQRPSPVSQRASAAAATARGRQAAPTQASR